MTHDSQQFTDAMEKVWHPPVLAKQNTPRAAKRFVNRVRYLALRQRGYQQEASWWERILFPQRLRQPAIAKNWQPIPEPLLIAMAAVEQVQPIWIYDETAFQQVIGDNGIAGLISHDVPVLLRSILLHRGFRSRCFCDRELPRLLSRSGITTFPFPLVQITGHLRRTQDAVKMFVVERKSLQRLLPGLTPPMTACLHAPPVCLDLC